MPLSLKPYTCYDALPYFGVALSSAELNDAPPGVLIPRSMPGTMVPGNWPDNSVCFIRYDYWN